MLLADSNFWVALATARHEFHAAVQAWLLGRGASELICFCRSTQQSFLRLMTTEAVTRRYGLPALSNAAAWSIYEDRMSDSRFGWLDEPAGLDAEWKRRSSGPRASPKFWMDAYLAAFAISGDHELVTTDKAFKQFARLRLTVLSHG